jgi:hypothetical protein
VPSDETRKPKAIPANFDSPAPAARLRQPDFSAKWSAKWSVVLAVAWRGHCTGACIIASGGVIVPNPDRDHAAELHAVQAALRQLAGGTEAREMANALQALRRVDRSHPLIGALEARIRKVAASPAAVPRRPRFALLRRLAERASRLR